MSKDEFKTFVRGNPHLITLVHQHQFSWQELYEIYVLYGKEAPVFKPSMNLIEKYFSKETIQEFLEFLKNVDLASVQKTITGLEKAITILESLSTSKEEKTLYQERPIYKYYED